MRGLLARYDRGTQSLKTFRGFSEASGARGSGRFSATWPKAGTMRRGLVFQQSPLERLTRESASGLLPTPIAMDAQFIGKTLRQQWRLSVGRQRLLAYMFRQLADDTPNTPIIEFMEWMMGYPKGWTESAPSATPSSRPSRKSSVKPS